MEGGTRRLERARNQRHNVGGVRADFQIDRADIKVGDTGVTSGAQRGGGVSDQDTSLWRHQLTPRVIYRNIPRNIGARKREVSAGHRAGKVENS